MKTKARTQLQDLALYLAVQDWYALPVKPPQNRVWLSLSSEQRSRYEARAAGILAHLGSRRLTAEEAS